MTMTTLFEQSDSGIDVHLGKLPSGTRTLAFKSPAGLEAESIPPKWTDAQAIRHAIATYDILLEQHVTQVELHKLRTVLDNYHA